MSNATFKIEFSDGRVEQRSLPPGVYQVGRDVGDIVLGDTNTSARHAELRVEPGQVTIADLGSSNGTYDSTGARISGPLVLLRGAPVTLGHSKITLLPDGPPAGGTRLMPARELPGGATPGGFAPPVQPPPAYVAPPPAYVPPPVQPSPAYVAPPPAYVAPPAATAPAPAWAALPAAGQPGPVSPGPVYAPLAPAGSTPVAMSPGGVEDRTVAILAYLTLLGFIAALVIHGNAKTRLGTFHLRQALGYLLTSMAGGIVISVAFTVVTVVAGLVTPLFMLMPFVLPLIWGIFGLGMLVLWILGLVSAIGGEMKPLPVVGSLYQKWFSKAFE